MKSLISFYVLICICVAHIALADSQQVRQYPLDEYQVFEIAVSCDRVTTISFPGPIESTQPIFKPSVRPAFCPVCLKFLFGVAAYLGGAGIRVPTFDQLVRIKAHPHLFHFLPIRRNLL